MRRGFDFRELLEYTCVEMGVLARAFPDRLNEKKREKTTGPSGKRTR